MIKWNVARENVPEEIHSWFDYVLLLFGLIWLHILKMNFDPGELATSPAL